MTPLASGPTSATTSSVEGLRLSPSIRVTPPMNQSVMPSTCSPARLAATACATSWTSTPTSNATAVNTPANQYASREYPATSAGSREVARK